MSLPLPFVCPVAGISQYQEAALLARPGDAVSVRHEPGNPYDANACQVLTGAGVLGYVPAALAARLVLTGSSWVGEVDEVLAGRECVGVRVRVLAPAGDLGDEAAASPPAGPVASAPEGSLAPPVLVRARSGRVLGSWVSARPGVVVVRVEDAEVEYPESMVLVETSAR